VSNTTTDVDYATLGDLGTQLGNLKGEFNAGDSAISPLLATISDGGMRAALQDFTNNWSDARRKLSNNLEQASSFAVAAGHAYRDVDETNAAVYANGGPS
jgi:hypothetical protein